MATNCPATLVSNPMEAQPPHYSNTQYSGGSLACPLVRFCSALCDWWSFEDMLCLLTCMTKSNLHKATKLVQPLGRVTPRFSSVTLTCAALRALPLKYRPTSLITSDKITAGDSMAVGIIHFHAL